MAAAPRPSSLTARCAPKAFSVLCLWVSRPIVKDAFRQNQSIEGLSVIWPFFRRLQENPKRLQKDWKEAINNTAAKLPTDVQGQLVQEHCKVFQFNNAIVSGFSVSYLDWPMAVFRTFLCMGGRTQLVLVVITVVSACAAAKLWASLSRS